MFSRKTTFALFVLAFLIWTPIASAWSWPVKGPVLNAFHYDETDPYAAGQHRGIDIGASAAGQPVVAPAGGTVTFAGSVPTSGKCVTIETSDGWSVTLTHLGSTMVGKGASVVEGAVVGSVGPSGTPELAVPYVHLGIRSSADANGYVDPIGLLPALASPPPDSGGSSSSGSAGVPAGTGGGTTAGSGSGSASAPAPTPVSDPVPASGTAAPSAEEPGGAGLVVRSRAVSAPAEAAARPVERAGARPAPRRPGHTTERPAQTVSKPRTFEGTVEERTFIRPSEPARPGEAMPESGLAPTALSVGPGILATLAALATMLVRTGRRRLPAAVVVRFPKDRELRRAA